MRAKGSSATSASPTGANASSASPSLPRRRVDLLVTGVGDDTDEQPIEPEVLDRLPGERDVPVVRGSNAPPRIPTPLTPRS